MGVPFPVFLGIVGGITELVPIIGPWIGGAAAVLVTLALAPDKVLWVVLLYLGIQLVENTILVPRIQGNALKLHPILLILIVVVASQTFGIWGVILGPPLVAMGKAMAEYFLGEWSRVVPAPPASFPGPEPAAEDSSPNESSGAVPDRPADS